LSALAALATGAILTGAGVSVYEGRQASARFSQVRELANHFIFDFERSIREIPNTLGARRMVADTARKYLATLAEQGQIHRIRGGAIPRGALGQERPFEQSVTSFAAEKLAIGRAAAAMIDHGESVIIDVGTTSVAAAYALAARTELRDVVVFTNGLKTALALERAIPRITVIVLGGTLRPLQHSLVDPLATVTLEQLTVSTVLLGCNGVDPKGGVTNINLPEAAVKRRMLEVARRRVVLADGSKIGRVELAPLCPVEDVDVVITGESASPHVVAMLRERGCEVRVAG